MVLFNLSFGLEHWILHYLYFFWASSLSDHGDYKFGQGHIKTHNRFSQTWANHHLFITTIILRIHHGLLLHKWPLFNDHLSTKVTILGSQGWSLFKGLTLYTWKHYLTILSKALQNYSSIGYFAFESFPFIRV